MARDRGGRLGVDADASGNGKKPHRRIDARSSDVDSGSGNRDGNIKLYGAGSSLDSIPGRQGNSFSDSVERQEGSSFFGRRTRSRDVLDLSVEQSQNDEVLKSSYEKYRLHKDEEVSVYAEEMDRRYGVDSRTKAMIAVAISLVVVVLAALLIPNNAFSADTRFSFGWLTEGVVNNASGLLAYASGSSPQDGMQYKLFLYVVVALAGAALGISGAVYQGSLRNSLASPTTLGVVSGGTLGMTLFVVFCYNPSDEAAYRASDLLAYYQQLSPFEYFVERYAQLLWTLAGCFIVVAFVMLVSLAAGRGKVSGDVLVITGQVVVMVITAALSVVRTYFASAEGGESLKAQALQNVRSMSFSSMYTALDVLLMAVPILVGVAIVVALRLRLNALAFDEDEVRSWGLSVNRTRALMVAACTMMTAVVISFCGSIGFVGFLVPHLARRIVGPDFNYLMPASALVGALFMVLAYFCSSFFALESFGGTRLLTSIFGGVVFVAMALRGRGRSTSDAF